MSNITIRPVSVENLSWIHSKYLEENQSDINRILGFIPSIADIQRHTVDDLDFDPDLFLGAFMNGELVGCIMGIRRPWKDIQKDTGFIKFIHVQKQFRRHGIGRMLMEACESRLQELGANEFIFGSSSPLYLFPGVPKESPEIGHLLETCGWHKQSERVSLFANIDEVDVSKKEYDELTRTKKKVCIDIATDRDKQEVLSFVENEFTYSWAVESRPALNKENNAYCSVLRSTDTGEVLGFAVVNATNPNWFGPMGVRSDLRKRGLGYLLVCHSLLTAKEKEIGQLLFPWINGKEGFYSKVAPKGTWQIFYKFVKQV